MVSIENTYNLRNFLLDQAILLIDNDSFKYGLLRFLGYTASNEAPTVTQLYKKCAILGFSEKHSESDIKNINILLGQAHFIDGTPSPWVSDVWIVLGIKLAVQATQNNNIKESFVTWVNGFLPQRLRDGRLDSEEISVANFILEKTPISNPNVALFLHFKKLLPIYDSALIRSYTIQFLDEFKNSYKKNLTFAQACLLVFIFDCVNEDTAGNPPNYWSLDDLLKYLSNIPIGLRKWTWEDKPRTRGGNAIKWHIENEYHVQNLLYILLAPIFSSITDENYTEPIGQKNPRIDLYLPSIHTIIEVKYRKDQQKMFQLLIGEVAEDASLYKADPRFRDCNLVVFLWDQTKATEEHAKFKEGVMKLEGINGCVVVSAPSKMEV